MVISRLEWDENLAFSRLVLEYLVSIVALFWDATLRSTPSQSILLVLFGKVSGSKTDGVSSYHFPHIFNQWRPVSLINETYKQKPDSSPCSDRKCYYHVFYFYNFPFLIGLDIPKHGEPAYPLDSYGDGWSADSPSAQHFPYYKTNSHLNLATMNGHNQVAPKDKGISNPAVVVVENPGTVTENTTF